jgi:hypothetical protein
MAGVIRVNAGQTNNVPDGGSWATAFPVVQQGIDAASDGDAVWAAAGTYWENITLKAGVALYGTIKDNISGLSGITSFTDTNTPSTLQFYRVGVK